MAPRRNTWLPKFDPSADFIVVRIKDPINGRKYMQDELLDKDGISVHTLKKMYEARIIAPVRSPDEEARLEQDFRRVNRGKMAVLQADPAPKAVEDEVVTEDEDDDAEEADAEDNSADEEHEVHDDNPGEGPEFDAAKAKAEGMGIKVDGRWKLKRINAEIDKAELREKKKARRKERTGTKRK